MRKSKLQRFAELDTFTNVFQNFNFLEPVLIDHKKELIDPKGKWNTEIFKNENPIILELACGKGEYTCEMAIADTSKNYIGVDVKGNRMHRGAKRALKENIINAFFLRTDINIISTFFAKDEVREIWITFPDPHLKRGKEQKRLTSERFLTYYRNILKPGGIIHLKTDDATLYEFTLETIQQLTLKLIYSADDIYSKELFHPFLEIKTHYEKMHLAEGRKIKYVQFSL
ncbi:MAG: tRNA (guanosine(46)-N7)-methyltransferase TrmB [Fimbriimonadaceae bacterium]|nr:tRNA (guanosine(46)-N7)-methyltransferase TrmB [Chitinophagales bacterium]